MLDCIFFGIGNWWIELNLPLCSCFLMLSDAYTPWFINPIPVKQLNLLGSLPKQVCHFSSLSRFCLRCKTISWRAARRLIVLHPKQNLERELKWQTCQIFWGIKWLIVRERVKQIFWGIRKQFGHLWLNVHEINTKVNDNTNKCRLINVIQW